MAQSEAIRLMHSHGQYIGNVVFFRIVRPASDTAPPRTSRVVAAASL
jgi:hypothetical protein